MDNRTNNRPLREAMEERYIGWIIGLERVTSVFRMIQILLVLLEWLLPLLEDVRLSANQRDIIAMFRDHLRDLEAEMQRQICEMREHILGRYRRTLQGWNTCDMTQCCMIDVVDIGDGVPDSSGKREKISVNDWAACDSVLQLRCMWDLHLVVWEVWWLWQERERESLESH